MHSIVLCCLLTCDWESYILKAAGIGKVQQLLSGSSTIEGPQWPKREVRQAAEAQRVIAFQQTWLLYLVGVTSSARGSFFFLFSKEARLQLWRQRYESLGLLTPTHPCFRFVFSDPFSNQWWFISIILWTFHLSRLWSLYKMISNRMTRASFYWPASSQCWEHKFLSLHNFMGLL